MEEILLIDMALLLLSRQRGHVDIDNISPPFDVPIFVAMNILKNNKIDKKYFIGIIESIDLTEKMILEKKIKKCAIIKKRELLNTLENMKCMIMGITPQKKCYNKKDLQDLGDMLFDHIQVIKDNDYKIAMEHIGHIMTD